MAAPRPTRRRWWLALAAVALACVGALWWGAAVSIDLLRSQVRVADARLRLDAVGRTRVELAANLVHGSATLHCLGAERLARLREATEHAAGARLELSRPGDSGSDGSFREAQERLGAALERVWPEVRDSRSPGAADLADDLQPRLADVETLLGERLDELNRLLADYRTKTSRFPGSLIAGVLSPGPGDAGSSRP